MSWLWLTEELLGAAPPSKKKVQIVLEAVLSQSRGQSSK